MTEPTTVERQVVGALGSIGAATLASRVLGFVRDMVVARAFGAGPITDAFFVAFRIPNILRRLLAEGALSTAVIPVFTDYASTRSRDEFRRLLRAILGAALLVLGATAMLGHAGADTASRAVYESVLEATATGVRTPDLGGHASTSEFTSEVIARVRTKIDIWSSL